MMAEGELETVARHPLFGTGRGPDGGSFTPIGDSDDAKKAPKRPGAVPRSAPAFTQGNKGPGTNEKKGGRLPLLLKQLT